MRDRVLVGGCRVGHAQRDRVDAVAVALVVLGDLVLAGERAGQHEPDPALLEHVRDAIAAAGLEPAVRGLGEPERVRVVVGRLGALPTNSSRWSMPWIGIASAVAGSRSGCVAWLGRHRVQ